MIKSIIKFSEIENRLDADYYRPRYLKLMKILDNFPEVKPLEYFLEEMKYGAYIEAHYGETGITFIRSENLGKYHIGGEILNISDSLKSEIENYRLKENDILIARTGTPTTVGNAGLITEDFIDAAFGSYTILIRVNEEKILPKFLLVFLKCKYGKEQSERLARGIRQKNINEPLIKSIRVPIPDLSFQKKIEKLFDKSLSIRKKADKILEKAENKLLDVLDIDIDFKEEQIYKTTYSNIGESKRLNTEYYKPKYKKLFRALGKSDFEITPLKDAGEYLEISNKKIDPTEKPSHKFKYISISNINPQTGEIVEHNEVKGYGAPSRARMLIRRGDVLVPYLSGSSDAVAIVPRSYDKEIASTGFYVLRPKKISPQYLFLVMRSEIVQRQFEQKTSGAIMASINKEDFENLLIPILPIRYRKKLSQKVSESLELLKKSRSLSNEATSKVEVMIEKKL